MKVRTRSAAAILGVCLGLTALSAAFVGPTAVAAQDDQEPATKQSAAEPEVVSATPTPQWAVQLDPGVDPDQVAQQLGFVNLGQVGTLEGFYVFEKLVEPGLPNGFERDAGSVALVDDRLASTAGVAWFEQQVARQHVARAVPSDPLYADQWHLDNTGQSGGVAGEDANVVPAWDAGYNGAGVTLAVVDDGLQHAHPDFSAKYVASASFDYNGSDPDPSPEGDDNHGTAVGGVAAADDDGAACGVGAAFGADVAGIRLTAAGTTDATDAAALTHSFQTNDIYNNSWGPSDVGDTLAAPGALTKAAFEDAVTNGRGGLGNIYVWAAGNGLANNDDVNFDGWANSRFTIAVGATDDSGVQSWYSEPGAAMFVNAPSSGDTAGITTTDRLGADGYTGTDCTDTFSGTSSSSPLAAGVVALMLDANPSLTWRDVQHILAETADKNDAGDGGWATNGAGYHVNHKYGFGRVDAGAATSAAATWTSVAPATSQASGTISVGQTIPDNNPAGVTDTFTVSDDLVLEHVEVVLDVTHTFRGDLEVVLTSPSGTKSVLASIDGNDSGDGYPGWKVMSVHHWGESPVGDWTLKISDNFDLDVGTFDSWQLILHGTAAGGTTNQPPKVSAATWSVPEDAASGTKVGSVSATDPDGDTLSYAITAGNTGGAFAINAASGAVTVKGALDFETKAKYSLTVSASDGTLEDTATVTVNVTDVPEFIVPTSPSFVDVPLGHTFFTDVEWMAWTGVTKGCNPPLNDRYCPDNSVTRKQMAAFLVRALGLTDDGGGNLFVDDDGSVFEGDIDRLGASGITKGCNPPDNDRFCPDRIVTRGQMAAFLVRALGLTDDGGGNLFVDDDGSVFEGDIDRLGASGITKGCNPPLNDRFCPDARVTRAQMAAFLHRALG